MNDKKIIQIKQKLEWHFASLYLEMLNSICPLSNDAEFQTKYDDLLNYVNSKIPLLGDGDLSETYVIVEQEVSDT